MTPGRLASSPDQCIRRRTRAATFRGKQLHDDGLRQCAHRHPEAEPRQPPSSYGSHESGSASPAGHSTLDAGFLLHAARARCCHGSQPAAKRGFRAFAPSKGHHRRGSHTDWPRCGVGTAPSSGTIRANRDRNFKCAPSGVFDERLPHRRRQAMLDQQMPEAIRALVEIAHRQIGQHGARILRTTPPDRCVREQPVVAPAHNRDRAPRRSCASAGTPRAPCRTCPSHDAGCALRASSCRKNGVPGYGVRI